MRKITISILALLSLVFTGCDMNKMPASTIRPDEAVESMMDASKFSNYIYANFRGITSGSYIYAGEIQADLFNATIGFGNNGGDLYRWEITTNSGDASNLWGGAYGVIANNNFYLSALNEYIAKRQAAGDLTAADSTTLMQYKGEAFFSRAYMYFQLATYFCQDYDEASAASDYGVPIVTVYDPSSDAATYPGRPTLAETFEFINSDLDSAEMFINRAPAVGDNYFTTDVVKAFRARVALYMDDYQTAGKYSKELVESGRYPFVADTAAYRKLWLNDSGEECIMQVFASINELANSSSYGYISYSPTLLRYRPYYIPTQTVMNLFDENDMRLTIGFINEIVNYSGGITAQVYMCNKFPGNPEFYKGVESNYVNSPKPFRIAEQYLILAEACANGFEGGESRASDLINELRANRISGYSSTSYVGDQLRQEIRDERVRELFAEGFRFLDLRRYGNGMDRGEGQSSTVIYMPGQSTTEHLSVMADNYRWVWPIPTAEITSNPQIEGQQNPGYSEN